MRILDQETKSQIIEHAKVLAMAYKTDTTKNYVCILIFDEIEEGFIIYANMLHTPSETDIELLDDIGSNLFAQYLEVKSDRYVYSIGADEERRHGQMIFRRINCS